MASMIKMSRGAKKAAPKPARAVAKAKVKNKTSNMLPPSGQAANNRSTRGLDYTGPVAQQRTAAKSPGVGPTRATKPKRAIKKAK